MALLARAGTFTKATGAAPAAQDVPTPFEVEAGLLFSERVTASGTFRTGDYQSFIGLFTAASQAFSHACTGRDNQATAATQRRRAAKAATIVQYDGTLLAEADVAISADKVSPTWNPNDGEASLIHYLVLAGLQARLAFQFDTAGIQGLQRVRFNAGDIFAAPPYGPDLVLLVRAPSGTTTPTTATQSQMCIGVFNRQGQQVCAARWTNSGATADARRRFHSNFCYVSMNPGLEQAASFRAMHADGFDWYLSTEGSPVRIMGLALKGLRSHIAVHRKTPAAAPAPQSLPTPFRARGYFFLSTNDVTINTATQNHGRLSLGAGDEAGNQAATVHNDVDAANPTQCEGGAKTGRCLLKVNTATSSTIEAEGVATVGDADIAVEWDPNDAEETYFALVALGDPEGVGLLTDALKADIENVGHEPLISVEVGFPSGTERWTREDTGGFSTSTLGMHLPIVRALPPYVRSVPDVLGGPQLVERKLVISDGDQRFSNRLGAGERIEHAPVVIRRGAAAVGDTAWAVRSRMVLVAWEYTGLAEWTLTIRQDDSAVRGVFPRSPAVGIDFPQAEEGARDAVAPLAYGLLDSTGVSNSGAVALALWDPALNRYGVCRGRAKGILNVYTGGTLEGAARRPRRKRGARATSYTVGDLVVNGRRYTVIDFASPQTEAVSCDLEGNTTLGDGTGSLVTDPADILLHLLTNFVLGAWEDGDWLEPDEDRINVDSFVGLKEYWRRRAGGAPYVAGLYIDQLVTGEALLKSFCESLHCRAWWMPDGRLAVGVDDPQAPAGEYVEEPWLRYPASDSGPLPTFAPLFPNRSGARRLTVSYGDQPGGSGKPGAIELLDDLATGDGQDALALSFGPRFV